jgi:hypothetical protein
MIIEEFSSVGAVAAMVTAKVRSLLIDSVVTWEGDTFAFDKQIRINLFTEL